MMIAAIVVMSVLVAAPVMMMIDLPGWRRKRIDRAERAALMEVSLDAERWGDQEHHDELRLRSIR